jgi:predicted NBD/HSP70 family sugar kinase
MPLRRRPGGRGPVDQSAVRLHNLELVLRHVADRGPRSRARIAAETGLNKTTVSSLASELIDRGLLRESDSENPGGVGRPGLKLELSGKSVAALGFEINVDYLAACATDFAGRVRHRAFIPCDNRSRSPEQVLDDVAALADELLGVLSHQRLEAVGAAVALPGLVDLPHKTLLVAPNLGWREVPVADLLSERLDVAGLPISIGNDADLGALAELWDGVGRNVRDFVFVCGAVGVGAGLVVGGELLRGASGFGGELGHVTVDPRGPLCACGNRGCLELFVGQEAMLRLAGITEEPRRNGSIRWAWARLIADRARSGDARVLAALADVGGWLSVGLVSLVNVLNPSAVVLGGYFAVLAEWLVDAVEAEIEARVLGAQWSACRAVVSKLGDEAPVRGAAALVLHDILANPRSVGRASVPLVVDASTAS